MEKKSSIKFISLILALVMVFMVFGCARQEETTTQPGQTTTTTTADETTEPTDTGSIYPFAETLEFTFYTSVYSQLAQEKSEIEKKLDELLNTNITYIKVAGDNYAEQLTALLATGDLPEVIQGGSLDLLVGQDAVLALDDYLEYMPNMMAFIDNYNTQNNTNLWAYLRYPVDGKFYSIPEINGTKVAFAIAIREDWLARVGKDVPVTMDDWVDVLTAFRDQDASGSGNTDDEIPFAGHLGWVLSSFGIEISAELRHTGVGSYFVVDNGQYIPIYEHERYPEALQFLADMYAEKLIDQEYLTTNVSDANITELWNNSRAGSGYHYSQHTVQLSNQAIQEVDPDGKMIGVPVPVGAYGDQKLLSRRPVWASFRITVAAEQNGNLEQILRYCDWGYTEEGSRLFSFGIEGETYEMVDGMPFYIPPYGEGWVAKRAFGIDNYAPYFLDPNSFRQSLMGGVASVDEMNPINALNFKALYDNEQYLYIPSPSFSTPASVDLGQALYARLDGNVDNVIMGRMTIEEFYEDYENIKNDGFATIAQEMAEAYDLVAN